MSIKYCLQNVRYEYCLLRFEIKHKQQWLHIIENILKPGGVLVMSFPNMNSHQARWFKGDWLHLDPPRHLFYFKPIDFIGLMQKKGFELVHEQHISLEQNPYGLTWNSPLLATGNSKLKIMRNERAETHIKY
jgi:hypothetical protein